MAPRKFPRIKRSDFVDGESYARALRYGGISHDHIRGGHGFGVGDDADFLRAVWGENADQTLDCEAALTPASPHTFQKKHTRTRRGRKKKSPEL